MFSLSNNVALPPAEAELLGNVLAGVFSGSETPEGAATGSYWSTMRERNLALAEQNFNNGDRPPACTPKSRLLRQLLSSPQ